MSTSFIEAGQEFYPSISSRTAPFSHDFSLLGASTSEPLWFPIRNLQIICLVLGQDLVDLLGVGGEVVDQVVPHLGLVLVLLGAIPGKVGDGEGPAGFEHDGDGALGDLHLGRLRLGRRLELFVGDAVGDHTALE